MNTQYLNEMFTLKKYTYDLKDYSLLDGQQHVLQIMVSNLSKKYGAKIWSIYYLLLPASNKMRVSFDTSKNITKTWSGPTYMQCLLFVYSLTFPSYPCI